MTRERHSNGATTLQRIAKNELMKPSAMAVYVAGSKSCICHGAMGGVARDHRVPKTSRIRLDVRLLADVVETSRCVERTRLAKIRLPANAIGEELRNVRLQQMHLQHNLYIHIYGLYIHTSKTSVVV